MRSAAALSRDENASSHELLANLERTCAEIEAQWNETEAIFSRGDKATARRRLVAEINGPRFKEADRLCQQMAAAADEQIGENTARVAKRVQQAAWVIGISGGLTLGLGGVLLWLFFRRVLVPLRGIVADARLYHGTLLAGQDHSEEDELRAVESAFGA